MKQFIRKCLVNFALINIAVYLIPAILDGQWSSFLLVVELLLATVTIHLGLLVTNKFTSNYPVFEIALELGMVLSVVWLFGWLFNWYPLSYMWMLFLIAIPVYIASYFLDIARTRRDVDFINNQIKMRKERMEPNAGEGHEKWV